jgi:hypothetical protein
MDTPLICSLNYLKWTWKLNDSRYQSNSLVLIVISAILCFQSKNHKQYYVWWYKPTVHLDSQSVTTDVQSRIEMMTNGFIMILNGHVTLTASFSLAKICSKYKDHDQVSYFLERSTMHSPPVCDLNCTWLCWVPRTQHLYYIMFRDHMKCLPNWDCYSLAYFEWKMVYQHGLKPLCSYDGWKGRKLKETYRLNEIISFEKMSKLHRNCILLMFNVCCDVMYILKWLPVWNDMHWLCTSKLILKQHVSFHMYSWLFHMTAAQCLMYCKSSSHIPSL